MIVTFSSAFAVVIVVGGSAMNAHNKVFVLEYAEYPYELSDSTLNSYVVPKVKPVAV